MNTAKKVMVIGLFMVVFGMVWMLANSLGDVIHTKNEANEAHSEVEKAEQDVRDAERELKELTAPLDAALKNCLEVAGYYRCQNVAMNNCLESGDRGYNECLAQWNEIYGRVINT